MEKNVSSNRTISSAPVYLTKTAAAQRQLDAAIRMYFAEEDELAIHTVAAAAYRIVRDLRAKRGKGEPPYEGFAVGLYYVARDLVEGRKLPKKIRSWAEKDQHVQRLAGLIRAEMLSTGKMPQFEDIDFQITGIDNRAYWGSIQSVANFLKHADIDSGKLLDSSKMYTRLLIVMSTMSYLQLGHQPTAEMQLWRIWLYVDSGDATGLNEGDKRMFKAVRGMKPEVRRRACLEAAAALKRELNG